jgi:hypothetical protein
MRSIIQPLLRRSAADHTLDWLRFRLDTFPRAMPWIRPVDYQELPWVGLNVRHAYRTQALATRWDAMAVVIEETGCSNAVDIGSNSGWFVFKLAERDIPAVGVDGDERLIRISQYARRRLQQANAGFLLMSVDPRTVRLVPGADCTILLSVWHHFVRDHGLEAATAMLAQLWRNTGKVLFFETGESDEMPAWWRLPEMLPDSRTWLERYLADSCDGGDPKQLGWHETTSRDKVVSRRNLFAVVRRGV